MKDLVIGGKKFKSRFFLGTGKFASSELLRAAIDASGTELVTTALTRIHEGAAEDDDILKAIDRRKVEVMLNTSGARNADEAVRIAKLGKAAGFNWIKIEVHPDARYLLSAILGPWAGFLSMIVILAIQALFFADGGLLALGANVWNMAFYGCFVGYFLIYRPLMQGKLLSGKGRTKLVLASVLGCVVTLHEGRFYRHQLRADF